MSKKVITFGELMLRLAPENYLRFVQSDNLTVQTIMGFFTYGTWSYIILFKPYSCQSVCQISLCFSLFISFFLCKSAAIN